jgi:hypothetical protein
MDLRFLKGFLKEIKESHRHRLQYICSGNTLLPKVKETVVGS